MKKGIILILIFLPIIAKCQVSYDTLIINASVITELNKPLTTAIDRHIEVSKAKKRNNKNDFFVIITIFPGISQMNVPKHVVDSIYAINDLRTAFSNDTVLPPYYLSIVLASKKYKTEGWINIHRKNIYFFKYNDYDVLICSELNLLFGNENQSIQLIQKLVNLEKPEKKLSFQIWTIFSMWNNRYLTEIRYKDLIYPHWTGKRDEFK